MAPELPSPLLSRDLSKAHFHSTLASSSLLAGLTRGNKTAVIDAAIHSLTKVRVGSTGSTTSTVSICSHT